MRLPRLIGGLAALATLLTTGLLAAPGSGADPAGPQPATTQAGTAGTIQTVVRPVTADRRAAEGWKVHRETDLRVTCADPAAAAVDDGIGACYPTVAYTPSCWKSRHRTVLCLRDPLEQRLVRVKRAGAFGDYSAPASPRPQALVLRNGDRCNVRFGGAWSAPASHPQWVGFYFCDHGTVYAPGSSADGIIDGDQPWRVRLWVEGTRGKIVQRKVAEAYYVGTAS
jgi:hypothetical protein